jgi:hypothetical protein
MKKKYSSPDDLLLMHATLQHHLQARKGDYIALLSRELG